MADEKTHQISAEEMERMFRGLDSTETRSPLPDKDSDERDAPPIPGEEPTLPELRFSGTESDDDAEITSAVFEKPEDDDPESREATKPARNESEPLESDASDSPRAHIEAAVPLPARGPHASEGESRRSLRLEESDEEQQEGPRYRRRADPDREDTATFQAATHVPLKPRGEKKADQEPEEESKDSDEDTGGRARELLVRLRSRYADSGETFPPIKPSGQKKPASEEKQPTGIRLIPHDRGLQSDSKKTTDDYQYISLEPETAPEAAEPAGPRFAVILEPNSRVDHDKLIEQLAAFTGEDITTTRRGIRRGKGILGRDLSRGDAILLESALRAEELPVVVVEQTPELDTHSPVMLDTLKCRRDTLTGLTATSRFTLEASDLRMLGAGVVARRGQAEPARMIVDIFGAASDRHWRLEEIAANPGLPESDDASLAAFVRLVEMIQLAAPEAFATPIFELLAEGRTEPRHYFSDHENYDNYHQWYLWAHEGKRA